VLALTVALGGGLRSQEDGAVAVLRRMLTTVNAGDAQGYAALYAPAAIITIYGSGQLTGRRAIEQHEVALLKQFPGTGFAMYDIWRAGDTTIAHYAVNGRTPAGRAMGHEGLLFFRFDANGLIQEEHRYQDSLTPMAQLGALPGTSSRSLPQLPARPNVHIATGSAREQSNLATVQRLFDALNTKNEAGFLAAVADEVTIDEVMLPTPYVGRGNARTWFALWSGDASSAATVVRATAAGDFVLVEATQRGVLAAPLGPLKPGATPFSLHRAAIVRLADGSVTRITSFLNGKELAESLGQWPIR
jgi:uncharacterized protein (TIGR02246 family)